MIKARPEELRPGMNQQNFGFRLIATDGAARAGEVTTAHGVVRTPAFMPVGTQATVKGVHPAAVRATGADIILGNTYHLMLRPGAERIAALGGLHKFMNWPHPILTDSGGFQVMSLSELRKLDESGVTFRSHIDGAMVALSPERAIEIQNLLGSDIVMQLDECLKLPATRGEIERAMRLSLRWASDGPLMPFVRTPRAGLSVQERTVVYEYTNRWALLAALADNRATLRDLPSYADEQPVTLALAVYTKPTDGGPAGEIPTQVFLRLTVLAPGTTQALDPPSFPERAPLSDEVTEENVL